MLEGYGEETFLFERNESACVPMWWRVGSLFDRSLRLVAQSTQSEAGVCWKVKVWMFVVGGLRH